MNFDIPDYVESTLDKLKKHNYQAFIVGGSVRDLIIGKKPSDFDITTNAKPNEIEKVFQENKTILIGEKFGTVTVVLEKANIEITTFRTEDEYLDGRRPSKIEFSNEIQEDLSRRDFTINAMAYNKEIGLMDIFGGVEDLRVKKIRSVGDPKKRFQEDHLRILRAVRFASQLNFSIEEETAKACKEMSYLLEKISAERIRQEFFQILLAEKPSYGLRIMKDLKILETVIPELISSVGFDQYNPHHNKDVFNHILCVVDNTPPILEVRLAALLHDIGKPETFSLDGDGIGHFYGHDKLGAHLSRRILKRLKSSKEVINNVSTLVDEHMTHHNEYKDKGLKRLINRVGEGMIFNLLELQKSDRLCSSDKTSIDVLIQREKRIKEILQGDEAYEKKQLAIDGHDIINLGYKQGKIIGEILEYLMEEVIDKPDLNTKEKLTDLTLKQFRN